MVKMQSVIKDIKAKHWFQDVQWTRFDGLFARALYLDLMFDI